MAGRIPTAQPPQLEPRESVLSASSHFVFQIGGNLLAIIAVWAALAGLLGVTGTMGSGWQGRLVGAIAMVAAVGLFLLGRRMAIENRVMRRRRV
jgi:hypothetical protein